LALVALIHLGGRFLPSFARELEQTLHRAVAKANGARHEYATLEHLLWALTQDSDVEAVLSACEVDPVALRRAAERYLDTELGSLVVAPGEAFEEAKPTAGFQRVIQRAVIHVQSSGRDEVTGANVLIALFSERESHAAYFLQEQDLTRLDVVNFIAHGIAKSASPTAEPLEGLPRVSTRRREQGDAHVGKIKRTVRRNKVDILNQSQAIIVLIDEKIRAIETERPNSDEMIRLREAELREFSEIRGVILDLKSYVEKSADQKSKTDELESIADAIHAMLIKYIRDHGCDALNWTFKGALISLLAVVGSLCGIAPITATTMGVIVGGKVVVDGLKAIRGSSPTRRS
jgi:hypothetical protein